MLGQHVRTGDQAHDKESSHEDGHPAVRGDAKGNGRNQPCPLLGIVGSPGAQHPANIAFAEALPFLRGFSALHCVSIGDPLRYRPAEAGQYPDEGTDETAPYREPEVAARQVLNFNGQMVFYLNPTRVDEVKAVADARSRMPQKSTDFYPKLPTGLVIYPI